MKNRRAWRSELISWGFPLLLGGVLIVGMQAWQSQHLLPADAQAPAPPLELSSLDGAQTTLAGLGDTPVLLHFWATW